jgi:hypothetical protein
MLSHRQRWGECVRCGRPFARMTGLAFRGIKGSVNEAAQYTGTLKLKLF